MRSFPSILVLALLVSLPACRKAEERRTPPPQERPSILLVTLDTTRYDAIGPEAKGVSTPSFNALVARGRRFTHAWSAVPQTLPSHATIFSGLYPAGHGIHENARYLGKTPLASEALKTAGYRTAAFVSSFVLDRRFGLGRGFDSYDDTMQAERSERSALATTDRALEWLRTAGGHGPVFLWVHYFDPHAPYEPAEPFRSRHASNPYLGEVAAMDEQLGRLADAFEKRSGRKLIIVAGDHGEGLGDHGEAQHGNLVYDSTMRVPLVVAGDGVAPGVASRPVSIRRIHHTLLEAAGLHAPEPGLLGEAREVVLGEAMKPFLQYGWQPQVMAVDGTRKAILAGRIESYDLAADPAEARPERDASLSRELRAALSSYPLPSVTEAPAADQLSPEEQKQLASLGYVASSVRPAVRPDAPRPADMVGLFDLLDHASGAFVAERYAEALPLLDQILRRDPGNLEALLRLGVANSRTGRSDAAVAAFERARTLAPESTDVLHYLAMHHVSMKAFDRAAPLLEAVLAREPQRLPALEALSLVREAQGHDGEAFDLAERAASMKSPSVAELRRIGDLAMRLGRTEVAIQRFEAARNADAEAFDRDLELGVLYLAARQFEAARVALDRALENERERPMALFKRAQVSVLLGESDRAARIQAARAGADVTTRELIARERLFAGM